VNFWQSEVSALRKAVDPAHLLDGPVVLVGSMNLAQCVSNCSIRRKLERPSLSKLSDATCLFACSANCSQRGQAFAAACVIASVNGNWDIVLKLLAEGNMDIEQQFNGRTALMIAAEHAEALPVFKALIRLGAACGFVGL
jgi:hypothetical protein